MVEAASVFEILGAVFSLSRAGALGGSAIDLGDLATRLDAPVSDVWRRLHPLVHAGIFTIQADEHTRLTAILNPDRIANSPRGKSLHLLDDPTTRVALPRSAFAKKLEKIAFSGTSHTKPTRGRPRNDFTEAYRSSREIWNFWKEFIRRFDIEFGHVVTLTPVPGPGTCNPLALCGAAMVAFGPDKSGRLSGSLDDLCATLDASRAEVWPSLERLMTVSATTIRSGGHGTIDISIAPGWTWKREEPVYACSPHNSSPLERDPCTA